ncbi:MAG: hypothetical protein C4519_18275 [Desulfobacteraceae bacterium]|nr:MAG: hypothetical protein C4519_18275 [Desulfobacteraceae bacterium]
MILWFFIKVPCAGKSRLKDWPLIEIHHTRIRFTMLVGCRQTHEKVGQTTMKTWLTTWGGFLVSVLTVACSVMPAAVKNEAVSDVAFNDLVQDASRYTGQTVILGGYVVEVRNEQDLSRLIAVQAPLGIGDEPKSKDMSQGRLIVEYKGFLDPEVYTKDRKITVAGKLLGSSATEKGQANFPFVRMAATQVHLWDKERPLERDPYWHYWRYPYPYPYLYPWGWPHPYVW